MDTNPSRGKGREILTYSYYMQPSIDKYSCEEIMAQLWTGILGIMSLQSLSTDLQCLLLSAIVIFVSNL